MKDSSCSVNGIEICGIEMNWIKLGEKYINLDKVTSFWIYSDDPGIFEIYFCFMGNETAYIYGKFPTYDAAESFLFDSLRGYISKF